MAEPYPIPHYTDNLPQPLCRHFLSKGMFITGLLDPETDPVEPTGDGNCWCNLTQHAYGPDDSLVERDTCIQGRACHEIR